MAEHVLKVQPPYLDALLDGSKTFEVRRNDRAYQRGDMLVLREWHPEQTNSAKWCPVCNFSLARFGHWSAKEGREARRVVTFVYAGDPRFGGIEPGHVVLALAASRPADADQEVT